MNPILIALVVGTLLTATTTFAAGSYDAPTLGAGGGLIEAPGTADALDGGARPAHPDDTPTPLGTDPTASALDDLRGDVARILDALPDVQLAGDVTSSYVFNLGRPADHTNRLRAFDLEDDGFSVDLVRLTASTYVLEQAETRIDLLLGETATELGKATHGSIGTDGIELEQAFVAFRLPVGSGLGVQVGKFATLLGAEVIESPDNDHFSRSLNFTWAIPFTHTGVLFDYAFLDGLVELEAGAVNGWDNVEDNNHGKSVLGRLTVDPGSRWSVAVSGIHGAEQDDRSGPKRSTVDAVITIYPLARVALVIDGSWGREDDAVERSDGRLDDGEWRGLAASLRVDARDDLYLAVRGEVFDDLDGARTGTAQQLWEVTTTAAYEILENLTARAEYRHDESDELVFDDTGRPTGTQDTVSVDVYYRF